jgi:hypothetical protein
MEARLLREYKLANLEEVERGGAGLAKKGEQAMGPKGI